MSEKVLGKVEPKCAYCEYGQLTPDGKQVLCIKKGIFDANFSCRKFRYDPLKKIPRKGPSLGEFTVDDFKI